MRVASTSSKYPLVNGRFKEEVRYSSIGTSGLRPSCRGPSIPPLRHRGDRFRLLSRTHPEGNPYCRSSHSNKMTPFASQERVAPHLPGVFLSFPSCLNLFTSHAKCACEMQLHRSRTAWDSGLYWRRSILQSPPCMAQRPADTHHST